MIHAIAQGHHREDQQRADLNHVDGDVHRRRAGHAANADIGDPEREHDRDQHHEHRSGIGCAHKARPYGSDQVADQDAHHRDHDAGINPVVQMRAPADDELRKPRVAPDFLVVEERLLREIIGAAGARIELRQLGIADCGCQAKQEGQEDAGPHGRRRVARRPLDHES